MTAQQKKFVVYTVLVGGYDNLLQPLVVDDRFDYILFTDDKHSDEVGVWQVRTFDYYNEDKTIMSRYPKMHPEELLPEYMASLYIDANIQITRAWVYERFVELFEQGVEWGGRWLCTSLFDHVYLVLLNGFESKWRCISWSKKMREDQFPRYFPVFENNVIFRVFSDQVRNADRLWWDYYVMYSRRDQLMLSYVFWLVPDLRIDYFVQRGQNTWALGFSYFGHNKGSGKIRFPYHSYAGYVQLRLMNRYPKIGNALNGMFYSLRNGNRIIALAVITFVSWLLFVFYAPVVYYKKYFCKSRR